MHVLLLSVGVFLCAVLQANAHTVVLKGATLIDVDNYGNSTRDLPDAVSLKISLHPSARVRSCCAVFTRA